MIVLPTRRRLERRRELLYQQILCSDASVIKVEQCMRRIHIINLKLLTYFHNESKQIDFEDKDL